MKQAEITICGKQVKVAYCYATEVAYEDFTKESIHTFMSQANDAIQAATMPETKKSLHLILSAVVAYYGENAPVTIEELKKAATPQEFGNALGTIIGLYNQFYTLPADEPADKPDGEGRKNS